MGARGHNPVPWLLQPMNLAIETRGLTRRFGSLCAVDAIDLRVERGTFYGFLGPNGAGESKAIKMITGLVPPSAGPVGPFAQGPGGPDHPRKKTRRLGAGPGN